MTARSNTADQLVLGQRAKPLARKPAPVVDDEVDEPDLPPESSKPARAAKIAPFARCPSCGGAAEDAQRLRVAPFRGIACFWCGARIGVRDFPNGAWGVVTVVYG